MRFNLPGSGGGSTCISRGPRGCSFLLYLSCLLSLSLALPSLLVGVHGQCISPSTVKMGLILPAANAAYQAHPLWPSLVLKESIEAAVAVVNDYQALNSSRPLMEIEFIDSG